MFQTRMKGACWAWQFLRPRTHQDISTCIIPRPIPLVVNVLNQIIVFLELSQSGNRLYKFNLSEDNNDLTDSKLMLSLPASPGNEHNGGKIIIGPDNNIYLVIGSLMGHKTAAQNYENGEQVDTTGGVLRIDSEGNPVRDSPLGVEYPLNIYFAYGIRNSFGMDFDPITGNLWNTENGPDFGDEINLVKPGFNSGWKDVQGIWKHKGWKATRYFDKSYEFSRF